jgi:hypothetical protein
MVPVECADPVADARTATSPQETLMNKLRTAALSIATAMLAIAAGTGTAHAGAPAVASSSSWCNLEFVSLTATNLWHNGGKDWIWFVMEGYYYPGNTKSVPFFQGTTQTAGTFGNPIELREGTSSATFQVVLDRTWPTANVVIDSNQVSCATTGSNLSLRFTDGNATYTLKYNATQV